MPKKKPHIGKVHKSDKQPVHLKAPDQKLSETLVGILLEAAALLPQCNGEKDRAKILMACVKLQEAAHHLESCHLEAPERPECPVCHRPVEKKEASWETPEGATYHRWCHGEGEASGPDTE